VAEVADDLPPLISDDIAIDMDPKLRELYETAAPSGKLADVTNARVIAAHGHVGPWNRLAGSAKGEVTLGMLREIFDRREKALVFASFARSLERLELMVREAHPDSYLAIVDGRKAADERQRIIDEFTDHNGPGALFLNPKAAGEGLNIVAANHVIHFNPEWNPATTKQATARAYRRKQTLPVFVHHLYYANTVEDDAMSKQEQKAALADNVAAGHASQNQ
jgi:SNF2 family DNA or RNA helicase